MRDWLQKYVVPVYSPPDEAVSSDAAPPGPVVVADPAAAAPAADDAAPDPALEPTKPAKEPWFLKRIAEESAARRAETDRATAAERRAAVAEELATRLQQAKPAADSPPVPPSAPRDDRQAEIRAEAARQRFYEDTVDIRNKGIAQFGASFVEALNILGAVGLTSDESVADVIGVDRANAHVILEKLAKDPERAATLAQMSSRQRIAELTRMTMPAPAAVADPKPAPSPKSVSKAPAPAPIVQPSAVKVVDGYSDAASDEEFTAKFNERAKARFALRR